MTKSMTKSNDIHASAHGAPVSGGRFAMLERLDGVGTFISTACAIHCMAVPFLITFLPMFGLGFLAHRTFDLIMITIAVSLATMALCWGNRIHGQYRTFLFVVVALSAFLLGHLFEERSFHWMFMTAGGVALAAGHLLNRKLCKSCKSCNHH